jgi:hypothetical protein
MAPWRPCLRAAKGGGRLRCLLIRDSHRVPLPASVKVGRPRDRGQDGGLRPLGREAVSRPSTDNDLGVGRRAKAANLRSQWEAQRSAFAHTLDTGNRGAIGSARPYDRFLAQGVRSTATAAPPYEGLARRSRRANARWRWHAACVATATHRTSAAFWVVRAGSMPTIWPQGSVR